jgi:hypothetical protein
VHRTAEHHEAVIFAWRRKGMDAESTVARLTKIFS